MKDLSGKETTADKINQMRRRAVFFCSPRDQRKVSLLSDLNGPAMRRRRAGWGGRLMGPEMKNRGSQERKRKRGTEAEEGGRERGEEGRTRTLFPP